MQRWQIFTQKKKIPAEELSIWKIQIKCTMRYSHIPAQEWPDWATY